MPTIASKANLSDEQLAQKVRANDKELYSEIIRRYEQKLAHYLRKFVSSPDELEDILQETFIKIYRNLNDFDADRKFSSWVYRIAHNEAVNYLKKFHRGNVSLEETEWEIVDDKPDALELANTILDKRALEKALTQLPEKYRAPIILYFFEQRTYEEIGEILRLPRNSVGTLIMRGKSAIKKYLNKSYERK